MTESQLFVRNRIKSLGYDTMFRKDTLWCCLGEGEPIYIIRETNPEKGYYEISETNYDLWLKSKSLGYPILTNKNLADVMHFLHTACLTKNHGKKFNAIEYAKSHN